MHLLSLLSKDQVKVQQDGIKDHRPYGTINIGIMCDPEAE